MQHKSPRDLKNAIYMRYIEVFFSSLSINQPAFFIKRVSHNKIFDSVLNFCYETPSKFFTEIWITHRAVIRYINFPSENIFKGIPENNQRGKQTVRHNTTHKKQCLQVHELAGI